MPKSGRDSQGPPIAAVARNMERTVSVLIADDDAAVREALADLLSEESSIKLVDVAATADEAIEIAAREQPNVAVVDVRMPGGGGPRAVREIAVRSPSTRCLAFSVREDTASVYEMLELGASGYLVKGAADREIVEAIHRAARSQLSMSAELATACFRELLRDASERKKAEATLLELAAKPGANERSCSSTSSARRRPNDSGLPPISTTTVSRRWRPRRCAFSNCAKG